MTNGLNQLAAREAVNHPDHYGGGENLYEAIKVIEAWDLNFHLGNAVKYIARAGKKGPAAEDLKKALWYLQRELDRRAGDFAHAADCIERGEHRREGEP